MDNIPDDVDMIIRHKAVSEWPDDFEMQMHVLEKQTNSYLEIQSLRNRLESTDLVEDIFTSARLEWIDDYDMQLYTIEKQLEAASQVAILSDDRIPTSIMDRIRTKAISEWPNDYSMQIHTLENQIEAWLSINEGKVVEPAQVASPGANEAPHNQNAMHTYQLSSTVEIESYCGDIPAKSLNSNNPPIMSPESLHLVSQQDDFKRVLNSNRWEVDLIDEAEQCGIDAIAVKHGIRVAVRVHEGSAIADENSIQTAFTAMEMYDTHLCAIIYDTEVTSKASEMAKLLKVALVKKTDLQDMDTFLLKAQINQ